MPQYTKSCVVCNEQFETKRSHTKFCSPKCLKKDAYPRTKILKNCKLCNKEFLASKKEVQYCSVGCVNTACKTHPDVTKECLNCKKEFTVSYIKRNKQFCSRSCSKSGEFNWNHGKLGIEHPAYGQTPWTKGQTTETDPRIKALGKKISVKLKQKFQNGEMSNAGENNPMYGRNHTSEAKVKISETRSQNWIDGKYNNSFFSSHENGLFHSVKNDKDFNYRSSWEKIILEYLDQDQSVAKFDFESIRIKYKLSYENYHRTYIPDLLIKYNNGETKLIEVKPSAFVNTQKNQAKFQAAQKFCELTGFTFEIWSEDKLSEINKMLNFSTVGILS